MEKHLPHEQKHRDRHDGENGNIGEGVVGQLGNTGKHVGVKTAEPSEQKKGGNGVNDNKGDTNRQPDKHQRQDGA